MVDTSKVDIKLTDPEMYLLRNNKESGYNYRFRRQQQWLENYTLYRDNVVVNRLEQRQSVNIPLMKTTLRTLLKYVDDIPILQFENLDNDKDAEIFFNEYWKYTMEINNANIQDIVDKRQQFHFGRTFDQWQVIDGKIKWTNEDPEDILVSRYVNPSDLHSTRFLIHNHIFLPLSTVELNPDYNEAAIAEMKLWYATEQGLIKVAENTKMLTEKNKKLAQMGVPDIDSPILGETYVELSLHFNFKDNEKDAKGNLLPPQFFLYIEMDNQKILMKKPLEEVIGPTVDHFWRTHVPYETWADDVDRQDFWTDGVADIVRTPNKILNAWFSQMVENRTLANYGMNYYNALIEGFTPGNFDPIPGGMYPVPGKPSDVFQRVDIPNLSDNMAEIEFLITMVQEATGSTTALQGESQRGITLGELKLSLGVAMERIKGLAKFYIPAWQRRGLLFVKMVEAAGNKLDAVDVYMKGKNNSDIYTVNVGPDNWWTKSGYRTKVWSQDEKMTNDTNTLQKVNAAKVSMPDNPVLDDIYKRKLLNFAELTPDEVIKVMEFEKKKQDALAAQTQGNMGGTPIPGMPGPGGPSSNPGNPGIASNPAAALAPPANQSPPLVQPVGQQLTHIR